MNHYFKQFFESSTIHGLVYISSETKFARLFWTLVVITGFTIATILINDAFTNWSESPIKTTVEKKSISELKFPKVTVCPPKNTFTDLNYDLMMLENMTLTKETQDELFNITMYELLRRNDREKWFNVSKLQEENRMNNWYHGYSSVNLPDWWNTLDKLKYTISTCATTGSIWTEFYGDKYDPQKIERKLDYRIFIGPPDYIAWNPKFILTLEIEKVSMNISHLSSQDIMSVNSNTLDLDQKRFVINISSSAFAYSVKISLKRSVTQEDIGINANLKTMPGFKVTWYYNFDVTPENKYAYDTLTQTVKFAVDLSRSPKYALLATNRLADKKWKPDTIDRIMEVLGKEVKFYYKSLQDLTGRHECKEGCKLPANLDLDKVLYSANHPVHIIDEKGSLSPSALIPFCWYGKNKILGMKHENFTMPICTGFEKKLRIDQVCYEFNPESIIKGEDLRFGLHLIVDDNKDLTLQIGVNNSEDLKTELNDRFEYRSNDGQEGIKVYFDSLGR